MRFYVTEKLGLKRSVTPEGFLVCHDVPIARTGTQRYASGETPVADGPGGFVDIYRDPDQVFRDETMASFHGKPLVNDHPSEDVTPDNWRDLAIGTVLNPRKGSDDMLVADIMVTDKNGIALVNSGKVEVSCGYDADYEEIEPGLGRQLNIIGNHLALVDRGRCGPRCAIGDNATVTTESSMAKKFSDFLRAAFKAKDATEMEAIEKEAQDAMPELSEPAQAIHVHIGSNPSSDIPNAGNLDAKPPEGKMMDSDEMWKKNAEEHAEMMKRIKALEDKMHAKDGYDEDETVMDQDMLDEMGEEAQGMKDSAKMADSFSLVIAQAEIVAPGKVRGKAFDSVAKPKTTLAAIHAMRLDAIEAASKEPETAEIVAGALGRRVFDRKRLSVKDARTVFNTIAAFKRQSNNAPYRNLDKGQQSAQVKTGISTLAELNARFAAMKFD